MSINTMPPGRNAADIFSKINEIVDSPSPESLSGLDARLARLERFTLPYDAYVNPTSAGIFTYGTLPGPPVAVASASALVGGELIAASATSVQAVIPWTSDSALVVYTALSPASTIRARRLTWTGGVLAWSGDAITLVTDGNAANVAGMGVAISPTQIRVFIRNGGAAVHSSYLVTWTGSILTSAAFNLAFPVTTVAPSNNRTCHLIGAAAIGVPVSHGIGIAARAANGDLVVNALAQQSNYLVSHDVIDDSLFIIAGPLNTLSEPGVNRLGVYLSRVDDTTDDIKSYLRIPGFTYSGGLSVLALSPTLAFVQWTDAGSVRRLAAISRDPETNTLGLIGVWDSGNLAAGRPLQNILPMTATRALHDGIGPGATGRILMRSEFVPGNPIATRWQSDPAWNLAYQFDAAGQVSAPTAHAVNHLLRSGANEFVAVGQITNATGRNLAAQRYTLS